LPCAADDWPESRSKVKVHSKPMHLSVLKALIVDCQRYITRSKCLEFSLNTYMNLSKQVIEVPASLPDVLAENLMVVFCGINPGLKSAVDGHHFSGRSNRFWKALHLAGFTPYEIAAKDDRSILDFGYGLTTAVERPTTRADELSPGEFREGSKSFEVKMERYKPRYVAFLGKAAYQGFSNKKEVSWGVQQNLIADATVWILPNPSGLNRAFQLPALVAAYGEFFKTLETDR
jgi:TDG/mug DNA glycosylase family protein